MALNPGIRGERPVSETWHGLTTNSLLILCRLPNVVRTLKRATRVRKTQCVCWGHVSEEVNLGDQDRDRSI